MKNKKRFPFHLFLAVFVLLPILSWSQGIEIESGGKIEISGAATIEINNGNFENNGTYTKGIETILFSGDVAKLILGSSITDFYNISISNSSGITTQIEKISSNDITVLTGGKFTIDAGKAVSVNGNLTTSDSCYINSTAENLNGSLIVSGTSTGNVTYKRWMTANKWHIVSAPVEDQSISGLLDHPDNSIAYKGDPDYYYGVTFYDEALNDWGTYFTSGTEGDFGNGIGYLMRRQTADGTVSFTGTVADADFNVSLSKTDYGWNALGNPFTSAMNANSTADAANNLITVNVNNNAIDPSYAALYVWDEQASYTSERNDYKVINHVAVPGGESTLTGQNYIQAGQGFIVKAKTDEVTFNFTRAMQTHQTATPFKSAEISEWADINIVVSNSESSTKTRLKFNEQMTNGLDIGYDAGILKGNPDFCLYTQLIEDNGVEFMLQCLPLQNLKTVEIPVGLDATTGGEITLSIQKEDFSGSLIPVLNDKLLDTQFAFNTESDIYTTTINDNIKGFGRFTLTFSSTTDAEDIMLGQAHFRAWYSNGLLNISGEIIGEGQATVYDINGRKLAVRRLMSSGRNQIQIPIAISGIYLVKVEDARRNEVLKVVKTGR